MDSPSQQGCLLQLSPLWACLSCMPPQSRGAVQAPAEGPEKEAMAWGFCCCRGTVTWAMGNASVGEQAQRSAFLLTHPGSGTEATYTA